MAARKRLRRRPPMGCNKRGIKVNSSSTIQYNNKAVNILRENLKERGQVSNFESFDSEQLNELLRHFYIDARKPAGEKYENNFSRIHLTLTQQITEATAINILTLS